MKLRQHALLGSLITVDEIQVTAGVLHCLAEEREKLRIEVNAPSRVRVIGDPQAPASVPESPD